MEINRQLVAIVPITGTELIVWFDGGVGRMCDVERLAIGDEIDEFAISLTGDAVTWPSGARISVDELYEIGREVDLVQDEKQRLLQELSRIRRESSFSQTRLGEAAGIRQSVISRIEGCEISPQINTLLKLLAPLGKTLAIVDLVDKGQHLGTDEK